MTSIIIGFSGAIIGLVYREDFKNDKKGRKYLLTLALYSAVPLTFLLTVYHSLIYGAIDFALKYAYDALILALVIFILVMLSVFYMMQKKEETGVENSHKPKEPEKKEGTESEKLKREFQNRAI